MELCLHWQLSSWTLYSQCVWTLPRVIISSYKRPTHKQQLQERDIEEEWCTYVNVSASYEFLYVFIYGRRCILWLTVMFLVCRRANVETWDTFDLFSSKDEALKATDVLLISEAELPVANSHVIAVCHHTWVCVSSILQAMAFYRRHTFEKLIKMLHWDVDRS